MIWELQMIYEDVSMDAQYMDAVKRGDMGTEQRMVGAAAKKVGYNVKAHHSTDSKSDIKIFDPKKKAPKRGGFSSFPHQPLGFFFAKSKEDSSPYGRSTISAFIRLDNPKEISYEDLFSIREKKVATRIRKEAENEGYDGFHVVRKNRDLDWFITFSSNQIKLADHGTYDDNSEIILLSKRFNPNTDDIRY